jgi:hypothetical protein
LSPHICQIDTIPESGRFATMSAHMRQSEYDLKALMSS